MVMKAIVTLKERSGSSLPAIKKYIAANYKVGGREPGNSLISTGQLAGEQQDTPVYDPQATSCLLGLAWLWAGRSCRRC
jgi:hypothetical protein